MLKLSQVLTTIKVDVELDKDLPLTLTKPDPDELGEQFARYGFKALLKKLNEGRLGLAAVIAPAAPGAIPTAAGNQEKNYDCILTYKQFEHWLVALQKCDRFAFDTETDSLNYMQANIVGLSFSIEAGRAAYIPRCFKANP